MDLVINLLPWREGYAVARRRQVAGVLAFSLLLSAAGIGLMWRNGLQTETGLRLKQESQTRTLEALRREKQTRQQTVAQMKARIDAERRGEAFAQKNRRNGALLRLLSRHIPAGLWLTQLESGGDGFVLQGKGTGAFDLFQFVQTLNPAGANSVPAETTLTELIRDENGDVAFTLRGVWEHTS